MAGATAPAEPPACPHTGSGPDPLWLSHAGTALVPVERIPGPL